MSEGGHLFVLEDDHELCELQIRSLREALTDVFRAKAFDMLPRVTQDKVRGALEWKPEVE